MLAVYFMIYSWALFIVLLPLKPFEDITVGLLMKYQKNKMRECEKDLCLRGPGAGDDCVGTIEKC